MNKIGYLVKRQDYYICSECRMKQRGLKPYCWFCDTIFSNYENIVYEYHKALLNEIKKE